MTNLNFMYDKNRYEDDLRQNHFYGKKLHFRIIENGTVLPWRNLPGASGFGGIIDENFNFIEGTTLHKGSGGAYTPMGDVKYINSPVIYMGMMYHSWGHCFTDNLKRIWFLQSDTYRKNFKNYAIIWAPMAYGGAGTRNFAELLKILGADISTWTAINIPIRFRYIVLPDESFFHDPAICKIFNVQWLS